MFTTTRAIIVSAAIATTLACSTQAPVDAGTTAAVPVQSAAAETRKTAVGVVESVDETSRTIAVKTTDGAVVTAEWTKDTAVTIADKTEDVADATADKTVEVSKDVAWGAMKGANVAIEYTEKGGKKTVNAVQNFGEDVPEVVEGTVEDVTDGGKKVAIKTKDGSIKVYDVSKDFTVDGAKKVTKGAKVVAAVSTKAARKVAHFFKGNLARLQVQPATCETRRLPTASESKCLRARSSPSRISIATNDRIESRDPRRKAGGGGNTDQRRNDSCVSRGCCTFAMR